jgi:Flp pilus assembly protein TadG
MRKVSHTIQCAPIRRSLCTAIAGFTTLMARLACAIRKSNTGVSAVEFALVFPLFLLFIFGIINTGQAYYTLSSLSYSVERAGRYAMINPSATSTQIIQQAQTNFYSINVSAATFTTASSTSGGVNYMTITARCPFSFLPARLFPYGTITLSEHVTVPLLP